MSALPFDLPGYPFDSWTIFRRKSIMHTYFAHIAQCVLCCRLWGTVYSPASAVRSPYNIGYTAPADCLARCTVNAAFASSLCACLLLFVRRRPVRCRVVLRRPCLLFCTSRQRCADSCNSRDANH